MIYFDHAATTAVDKQVLAKMEPFFSQQFGNPSSLHTIGQTALKAVNEARQQVADFLGCQPNEIVFTSGATEADNLAVRGLVKKLGNKQMHIITSAIEHPAILETCHDLQKDGIRISWVKPDSDGVIKVGDVQKKIADDTRLVTIMYANNEIGTIQPLTEIGQMLAEVNQQRDENKKIYLHTDAVQAALYLPMAVKQLKVDLLSLSGHKIYGPKGIGVLFIKKGTLLSSTMTGGHQEFGWRAGTVNPPLVVGLAEALSLIDEKQSRYVQKLRDDLWQRLQKEIDGVELNGSLTKRLPNNLNLSIKGIEGESLLLGLDLAGVAVSTGSACSSGSLEPSHVLMALGLSHEQAHASLRITLGKDNNLAEVRYFVKKLKTLVERFRKMSPLN